MCNLQPKENYNFKRLKKKIILDYTIVLHFINWYNIL